MGGVAGEVEGVLWEWVLGGELGVGARLPAERELAVRLGASRPSVRAAVQSLVEAGVVSVRQGSGATVLPRRAWSARALVRVIRRGVETGDWQGVAPQIREVLFLRNVLLLEVVVRVAGSVHAGALHRARAAIDDAWDARDDAAQFVRRDRRVIPLALEAAGAFPALWVLNGLGDTYLSLMAVVGDALAVPDGYRAAQHGVLDALESGDGAAARTTLTRYLEDLDRSIVAALPPALQELLQEQGAT